MPEYFIFRHGHREINGTDDFIAAPEIASHALLDDFELYSRITLTLHD